MLVIEVILSRVNNDFEEYGWRSQNWFNSLQAQGVCDFNLPLGDVDAFDPALGGHLLLDQYNLSLETHR